MGTLVTVSFFIFITLGWTSILTEAGSPCPEREMIYPCFCSSISVTKKISYTMITCSHVEQTSSLSRIFSTLRGMHIDRLVLYDSFWKADQLGDGTGSNKKLPSNWLSLLKIKEFDIIDSHLTHDFACDITAACPNVVLNQLTIQNSSLEDKLTTYCKQGNRVYYWTTCLSKLHYLSFVGNKLRTFDKNVFPTIIRELISLNLSHNEISAIGPESFKNLPKLNSLDLSHNLITNISAGIFGRENMALTFLDLSWNLIKQLSPDIFLLTPHLKHFGFRENRLTELTEDIWKDLSKDIKLIDLENNQLQCDCHIIWLNCTLKVHTNVLGYCINEGYENTPLRRVAKYMSERCNEKGEIEERVNGTKRNACMERLKKESLSNSLDSSNSYSAGYPVDLINLPLHTSSSSRRNRKRNPQS